MRSRRRVVVLLDILFRGLAHRRGMAVLILLVAVIASAAAAVAPIYRSAAAISALRARMVAAPSDASGVEVAGASWPGDSPDKTLLREVPRLPLATAVIPGMSVGSPSTQLAVHDGPVEFSALEWRLGDCAHVVFQSGRCPTGINEIALPVDAARDLTVKLGGAIVASDLARPIFGIPTDINNEALGGHRLSGLQLERYALHDKVVGLFDVPPSDSSYWFGQNPSTPVVTGDGTQVETVTALVPRAALTSLPLPFRATVTVDQPLGWNNAGTADATRVQSALKSLKSQTRANLSVFTSIPSLLNADAKDRKQLGHLVTLAQLQLLLLVGLVLIAVLAASMERRRAELVIATLQGRRATSTAMSIAAEPVLLLAIGVVPGLLISVPLASLASHLWLRPGTPVGLTSSSLTAAVTVAFVAAAATVILGFIAASRSLSDQLAEDARSAGGRSGAWIDVIAITLAAAGLIELFASHSGTASTPWSLLAPSLCGLAAGLALGRLVPAMLRPAIRSTAESTRLSRFLAVRELRRDRAAWRVTAMVALALSLLAFAVTVSRGAAADRTDRAGLIVGAPTVATVLAPPGNSLIQAVDRADPTGTWAMAAELLEPLGSAAQRTLAIDAPRLPAVAGWTRKIGGDTPVELANYLHVQPGVARLAVPLLTAGDVEGSTFALNNKPLLNAQVKKTKLLPQLLGQGAMADLSSLIAVAKPTPPSLLGTTQLTDQVWLGSRAPPDALQRLHDAGLTVIGVTSQAEVANRLERLAETAGLSGYLAVAIIAAILAIALLIGTSVAASSRQRTETLALTSAGVARSTVVRGHAQAAAVRLALVAFAALLCGVGTAHLSAHLVPEASPGAVPAPVLHIPLLPAVVAILVTLVPALVAEIAVAAYAAKRTDAAGLRAALP